MQAEKNASNCLLTFIHKFVFIFVCSFLDLRFCWLFAFLDAFLNFTRAKKHRHLVIGDRHLKISVFEIFEIYIWPNKPKICCTHPPCDVSNWLIHNTSEKHRWAFQMLHFYIKVIWNLSLRFSGFCIIVVCRLSTLLSALSGLDAIFSEALSLCELF